MPEWLIAVSGITSSQILPSSYQVVRYDMRGYGKSEPVDGEFSHMSDLVSLLDSLESANLLSLWAVQWEAVWQWILH
jgi:pimeloyl-ACP methyl ester carboxylesterase